MPPGTGGYDTLDDVGARTREPCEGSHSASWIPGVLLAGYDAPIGLIEGDVRELLTGLADERLVAPGPGAGSSGA